MTDLNTLITAVQNFKKDNLRDTIASLERDAEHQTGEQYKTVREYFINHEDEVCLVDLKEIVPIFGNY